MICVLAFIVGALFGMLAMLAAAAPHAAKQERYIDSLEDLVSRLQHGRRGPKVLPLRLLDRREES